MIETPAVPGADPVSEADRIMAVGIEVLVVWVTARGEVPTMSEKEGFRLLALHRQGAKGDPSFNACRETCRELAYRYNVATGVFPEGDRAKALEMMRFLARHLYFFITGKMEEDKLGEFCCSAKPLRLNSDSTLN